MLVAVVDVIGAAVVLPGIGFGLPDGFLQIGVAGGVFRVDRDVVVPLLAAVVCVAAIDRGHRHTGQKRSGGAGDHFGDLGLDDQVQAQLQALCVGVAEAVGLGHGGAAVGEHIVFQGGAGISGVVLHGRLQGGNQHIGGEVIVLNAIHSIVSVDHSLLGADAQGLEEHAAGAVHGEAVEQADPVDSLAVLHDGLGEGADVGDAEIGEFHTLHGIAVGHVAVAQGVLLGRVAENSVDAGLVIDTGGDVGAVPDAVGFGLGDVILENRQAAGAGGIDGGFRNGGREGGGDDHKAQSQHKAESKDSLEMFHDRYLHKFEFRFGVGIRMLGMTLLGVPRFGTVPAPVTHALLPHTPSPLRFFSTRSRASAALPAAKTPRLVMAKPRPPVSGIVKLSELTAVTVMASAPL